MVLVTKNKKTQYKSDLGIVYTPKPLADFLVSKVLHFLSEDISRGAYRQVDSLKIIDPACGEGELLHSVNRYLSRNQLSNHFDLYGTDIDKYAVETTSKLISAKNTLKINALFPYESRLSIFDIKSLQSHFNAQDGFDVLVANPPWGADMSHYVKELNHSDYTLNKGQFDSSDLFIELSLRIVRKGGYCAFIIPDSIFSHEKKVLRKLLTENTEIKYIARLGEKIFKDVSRGCTIIIFKNTVPSAENEVECMRLNLETRKLILKNELSYEDANSKLSHKVFQKRFSETGLYLFDIDTKDNELKVIQKLSSSKKVIGDFVSSSRGVELSKSGKVYKCDYCSQWNPYPNSLRPKCNHCAKNSDLSKVEVQNIVSKKKFKGSKPLLVGESIRRYSISSEYWISVDNKGINYKDISVYYEPKIIVRKTGVGITASIDYTQSLTNQVVYMFRPKESPASETAPIELVLSVINSRAMYYFLLKKYGETEWRSHPYLTQGQILNLPFPDIKSASFGKISKAIVSTLKPYLENNKVVPKSIDAKIERLVATLFGLTKKDYGVIYETFNKVDSLLPIKALTNVSVNDIF